MPIRMRLPFSVLLTCALAVDAAAQSAAAPQKPAPSGTSRVVGRVLSGSDTLADATVTLFLFTNNSAASSQWTATSGRDGGFDFPSLPAGRFRVVAERAGYSGMEVTAIGMRAGHDFTLTEGDVAHVDLVLHRAGSISGRVTRPDGSPAAGAEVMASLWVGIDPQAKRLVGLRRPVTADDNGRYVITDVPPGSFRVRAIGDSRIPPGQRTSVPTLFPSLLESEGGDPVVVVAGAAVDGIDIRLRRAADEYRLSGQVVDGSGRAVRSARLDYAEIGGQRSGGATAVGADGRFTTSSSFASGATVIVVAAGESADGPGIGVGSVQIGSGATEMPPIVLRKPGSIAGRLVTQGPLPDGMSPRLRAYHEHIRPIPVAAGVRDGSVAVGADGTFRVDGVLGLQRFLVQPLPPDWGILALRRRGSPLTGGVIFVESSEVVDGIEVIVGPRP